MEVRVHALALAECPDLLDGVLRGLRQPERLVLTDPLDQRGDLRPPREREAPVSPGRPAPADVLLEDDDVRRRLELLDPERRPEPRVAAADDADIRLRVLEELLGGDAVLRAQGFLEPE
jgi:hypothetical protein